MLQALRHLGSSPLRGRSRRVYAVIGWGIAALVPLLLFATLWIRSELNRGQREIESFLAGRAVSLSQRVDADLDPQLSALRVLASVPDLESAEPGAGTTLEAVLAEQPRWLGLAVVDGDHPLTRGQVRPDAAGLARVRETRSALVVAQERAGAAEADIYLYVPVLRGTEVRGVVAARLGIQELVDVVNRSRERGILASIIDPNDRVLTRSASLDTGERQELSPRLASSFNGQDAGLFTAPGPDRQPTTYAFSRSPLTGWLSVVSMDRRQLERVSTRSVWSTIAAGLLSLLLAVVLIAFIVHTVLERKVTDERLAASQALGELDARLLATTQEALTEQRKASSEREILLREIYHRVKNNLQIVQSLLRLGSRDLKPEQREPFESAVRRIGAMSRVHTLLYNSPDLASIDFKDYLDELLRELSDGFGGEERRIEHALSAASLRVPLDTAVPLAFIAVEILTNAFRHAFPSGRSGRITVDIAHDPPFGTLRIEDDGIGFSSDPTAKRRLGLTIVRKLVQQIGGVLEEPQPGSATFVVRFPLAAHEPAAAPSPMPVPALAS